MVHQAGRGIYSRCDLPFLCPFHRFTRLGISRFVTNQDADRMSVANQNFDQPHKQFRQIIAGQLNPVRFRCSLAIGTDAWSNDE